MKEKQSKKMKKLFSAIRNHVPLTGLAVAATATFLSGCHPFGGRPLGGAMPRPLDGDVVFFSQDEAVKTEKSGEGVKNEVKPAPATTDSKNKDVKQPAVKKAEKDKKVGENKK